MTIGKRISFWFLLLSIVSLMTLSLMGYFSGRAIIMSELRTRYVENAKKYMEQVDMFLAERHGDIQILAGNPIISAPESTPAMVAAELNRFEQAHPVYASLSFFDMKRIRIADTADLHLGQQHAMVRYWEDVLEGKISAGSDVRIAEELKIPIVYFAAPVKNKEGKAFGVVVAKYSPQALQELMTQADPGIERYTTLLNNEGYVIFTTDPYYKDRILTEKINQIPSVKAVMRGEAGIVKEYLPWDRTEHLTAYYPEKGFGNFKGNGWSMLVSVDLRQAMVPVHNFRNISLLIVSIVIILASLAALYVSKEITKPLYRLVQTTQKISDGDLNQRAEITSDDEIGQLSGAFNRMIAEIQKRNEELQTTNEELRSTNEELNTSNEELQSTTEELEAANEEIRTTQEELVQKEKLAAVGQLAAGVGHELRNPLGVIKNAAYYIKSKIGAADPKLAKHLDIMEREINNSNKIISDLLNFSKTRLPELIPADVNAVIEEAIAVASIPENIRVNRNLASGLPRPAIDRDQIKQVFLNIILNACQAMPEGGELKISSRPHKGGLIIAGKEKDCLGIEFADTGTGIAPENLQKMFDPFFTTKAKGIGLGLAVSKGIIEKHQGAIEIKNELNQGASFIVKLSI